jgi:hypothetical protein
LSVERDRGLGTQLGFHSESGCHLATHGVGVSVNETSLLIAIWNQTPEPLAPLEWREGLIDGFGFDVAVDVEEVGAALIGVGGVLAVISADPVEAGHGGRGVGGGGGVRVEVGGGDLAEGGGLREFVHVDGAVGADEAGDGAMGVEGVAGVAGAGGELCGVNAEFCGEDCVAGFSDLSGFYELVSALGGLETDDEFVAGHDGFIDGVGEARSLLVDNITAGPGDLAGVEVIGWRIAGRKAAFVQGGALERFG